MHSAPFTVGPLFSKVVTYDNLHEFSKPARHIVAKKRLNIMKTYKANKGNSIAALKTQTGIKITHKEIFGKGAMETMKCQD